VRALIASYSGILGGAERLLLDFASGIDGEAVVACPPGPLLDAATAAGLPARPLKELARELRASRRDRVLAPLRLVSHGRQIRSLVRSEAPDVVIGWGMRSALAAALTTGRRGRTPALIFQHNDLLPGPQIARLVRAMSRRAVAVSALSQAIADDLDPSGRLGGGLRVVLPGVDLEQFRPKGPPPAGPRAVLIGAIQGWKRPDLALEIVAIAARSLPDLRLAVLGGTMDQEAELLLGRLRRRAEEPDLRGRVEFLGAAESSVEALTGASCLLHCADAEPLGMVILEALACGRPVVAPAAGGPAEIVDAEVGRLYPPGDAGAGAAALVAVAGDRDAAQRMGKAARERAVARFDHREARRRYARLVANVAGYSPSASRSFRSPR
jgi:glycosyltransferase involved in cell wall biosynthesis